MLAPALVAQADRVETLSGAACGNVVQKLVGGLRADGSVGMGVLDGVLEDGSRLGVNATSL
jgi:hypothetical protein